MARQNLENLNEYGIQRDKINENFIELYGGLLNETIIIRSMDDFPAAIAGERTLVNGKEYYIDTEIGVTLSTPDKFIIPDGALVKFSSRGATLTKLEYTGTEAFFNCADTEVLSLSDVQLSCPNGSLFNIIGSSLTCSLYIRSCILVNVLNPGSISGMATLSCDFNVFVNIGDSFNISGIRLFFLTSSQYYNTSDLGNILFSFDSGVFDFIAFSSVGITLNPNENFIFMNPTATFNQVVVNNSACNCGAGEFFATGSLTNKPVNHYFSGNEGIPNSQKVASYYMNDNTTATATGAAGLGNWVKVAGATTQGVSLEKFDLPVDNRARFLNNTFIGLIQSAVSATTTNASAKIYEFAFFKNGILIPGSITKRTVINSVGAVPVQSSISLVTNDYVELYVRQTLGTESDILITDMNPYILGI